MKTLNLNPLVRALKRPTPLLHLKTKLTLPILTLLVALLALGGAPRAWAYPSSATGAYTVSQVGASVIYTFTGSGTFTPAVGLTANVLVVAGGGGGGGAQASGSGQIGRAHV